MPGHHSLSLHDHETSEELLIHVGRTKAHHVVSAAEALVASRQRVSRPGWWLAVALGRLCTFWIPSTAFLEDALLDSQPFRV
jgi:hypothetical protein